MNVIRQFPKLRLLGLAVCLAAGVMLAGAATSRAEPPKHVTFEDDASFPSAFFTATCGFPVFISLHGTLHITLRTGKDGVLHETDTFADWSISFSAPSTGESFSYKFGPTFFEYPDGVYIGAPSIVTLTGIDQQVPGAPAEAGRTVLMGEVIAVAPEGVPIVDFVGPTLSEHGNQLDETASLANFCAALAG